MKCYVSWLEITVGHHLDNTPLVYVLYSFENYRKYTKEVIQLWGLFYLESLLYTSLLRNELLRDEIETLSVSKL